MRGRRQRRITQEGSVVRQRSKHVREEHMGGRGWGVGRERRVDSTTHPVWVGVEQKSMRKGNELGK